MSAPTVTPTARRSPLAVAGPLLAAIVAAGLLNAVVAVIALAAGASDDFKPLQPGAYIFFTALGVLIGAAGWALIRRTAGARRKLKTLVPVVLVLSYIPDLAMLVSDYQPHADGIGVAALLAMHTIVAAVAVTAYQRALPVADA